MSWQVMADLPFGTQFYVNNGAWEGEIMEEGGKKHLHVFATDRKIDLTSDVNKDYKLDISITKRGKALIDSPAKVKAERERLLKILHQAVPDFHVTKASTVESDRVFLEGGKLPAIFDKKKNEIRVCGRGNRYSGAEVSIKELIALEKALQGWNEEVHFSV
jgi:hypothetical protein